MWSFVRKEKQNRTSPFGEVPGLDTVPRPDIASTPATRYCLCTPVIATLHLAPSLVFPGSLISLVLKYESHHP